MSSDFPSFGDYLNKKISDKKEIKSKLWDSVESKSEDFVTFEEYYSKKNNVKNSDVKSRLWDGVESISRELDFITFEDFLKDKLSEENQTGIPKHILDGLSKMKNLGNYLSIQDPSLLEKSKIEYYKALKEEEERRKKSLFFGRTSPKAPLQESKVCRIGTAIIGQCKIG